MPLTGEFLMRLTFEHWAKSFCRSIGRFLLGGALVSAMLGIGCSHHHYYRVYDPYYTDYHTWDDNETVYYRQWARENHRDPDRDFRRIPADEQKEYWTWRHNHGEHDRDQDHPQR
jgi:hypothetical protein